MTMLDLALGYARRGWHVFPLHTVDERGHCSCGKRACPDAGKHPRWHRADLPHGLQDATTDEATIRRWWERWPASNIGIATGPSGLLVLDVDPRHGGDDSLAELEAEHGPLPATVESITGGGGRHLLFDARGCHARQ